MQIHFFFAYSAVYHAGEFQGQGCQTKQIDVSLNKDKLK